MNLFNADIFSLTQQTADIRYYEQADDDLKSIQHISHNELVMTVLTIKDINKDIIKDINKDINNLIFLDCVNVINFGDMFDQSIDAFKWPIGIAVIKFGMRFNKTINVLPDKLSHLSLGMRFNQDITLNKSMYRLDLGMHFNRKLDDIIFPTTLCILILSDNFNQVITNVPMTLLKIHFGYEYEHVLPLLPDSLLILINSDEFNHAIVKWPESLMSLTFGTEFNRKVTVLPNKLQTLKFGWNFNQNISAVKFPQCLYTITFGGEFKQSLKKVTFLELAIVHDYSSKITINSCKFPLSLREIIHYKYNDDIDDYSPIVQYTRNSGQLTKTPKTT
jgi:hypothetical protein